MRIAIECSTWVNPRGYGRFTRELTRALLRADAPHQFTLVLDSGAARSRDLPDAPCVVVPTKRAVVDAATAEGSRSPIDMLRMAARLSRGFDAVLFPTNYSFVPVRPGPLVAVVIMDTLPETMPELLGSGRARLLWSLKSRLALWRADLLATISQASCVNIQRHLPVGRRDITVLTAGASSILSPAPGADDTSRVREAIGSTGRFILYVGGFSPHKRVPDLVRAFGEVAAKPGNEDLQLVLAGPDKEDGFASDGSRVREAIARIGPAAMRVVRPGFVSDAALAALYRAAECAVLPSTEEGFGLPAVEAMASGTPVIVTRTPALVELCGDAAEFFDTPPDLAGVIESLLADSTRRARLRQAGPVRAAQFSWDESARRLLAALERSASIKMRGRGRASWPASTAESL